MDTITKTKNFVCDKFAQFPHFSFGNGRIMSNHSLKVNELACQLAKDIPCNQLVVEFCALLHDIGKTAELDAEILEKDHEILGWSVAESFLLTCKLGSQDLSAIKDFFTGGPSLERDIVKDADILAFFFDPILQSAYIKWAIDNKKTSLISRKWEKFHKLKFEKSKEMGLEAYTKSLEQLKNM